MARCVSCYRLLAGIFRFSLPLCVVLLLTSCVSTPPPEPVAIASVPTVRVLLVSAVNSVSLAATTPPLLQIVGGAARRLDLTSAQATSIVLSPSGWIVGNIPLGSGQLNIQPATDASVAIQNHFYHGSFRLIPTASNTFDVINVIDVDSYLKSVISSELLPNWLDETYKAQAIVARTYAMYEARSALPTADYDLFADQRSQVYGGLTAETPRSRKAVEETAGLVVAAGPRGHEHIFKAYFSSCCGGIGQSAADAFGDPPSLELSAQSVGTLCSASPHYNWPPVTIPKPELSTRIRRYANEMNLPEKTLASVTRLDIAEYNSLGRPVRFVISDSANHHYVIGAQDLRLAINSGAPPATRLFSTLCQVENQPTSIRFFNGHGSGHGVGMCQWCAQQRAVMGMHCDAIVLLAYPGSVLQQAY